MSTAAIDDYSVLFAIGPGESTASVMCPEGTKVTGGGYRVDGYPVDWQQPYVSASRPVLDVNEFGVSTPVGWAVDIFNGTAGTNAITGQVWALCG